MFCYFQLLNRLLFSEGNHKASIFGAAVHSCPEIIGFSRSQLLLYRKISIVIAVIILYYNLTLCIVDITICVIFSCRAEYGLHIFLRSKAEPAGRMIFINLDNVRFSRFHFCGVHFSIEWSRLFFYCNFISVCHTGIILHLNMNNVSSCRKISTGVIYFSTFVTLPGQVNIDAVSFSIYIIVLSPGCK